MGYAMIPGWKNCLQGVKYIMEQDGRGFYVKNDILLVIVRIHRQLGSRKAGVCLLHLTIQEFLKIIQGACE